MVVYALTFMALMCVWSLLLSGLAVLVAGLALCCCVVAARVWRQ